ncbi:MAG: putative dsRNA-binding protein, partial [Gammaproteobacteria bacterium]|nr:putative dsRNA-binding protein [Gammaproteobacteria bacterium]
KSGGYRRDSILADVVEAIIGAVYLDSEFRSCQELVLRLYEQQLSQMPDPATLKDPKTRLQELLQSQKYSLPVYDVAEVSGKAHSQTFLVTCSIDELDIKSSGQSGSRRKAEQKAALDAISQVEQKMKPGKK